MLPTLKNLDKKSGTVKAAQKEHLTCTICHFQQSSNRELQNHYINYHKLKNCVNCNLEFSKLGKIHFKRCKPNLNRKPNIDENVTGFPSHLMGKEFWCLLCSHTKYSFDNICKHYLDKHHLKCKRVEDPDFEQVLRRSPYTLERLENYPYNNDNKYGILIEK